MIRFSILFIPKNDPRKKYPPTLSEWSKNNLVDYSENSIIDAIFMFIGGSIPFGLLFYLIYKIIF